MCFQKQTPLFLKVSQIPQENTCVGVSFKKLQACRPISCWFFSIPNMSNPIVCLNTSMDFQKLVYENVEEKKTFISQQTYLYMYGSQTF